MNQTTENIRKVIALSKQLLACADEGDLSRKDDRCGVLYGIVRDSTYRIILTAEEELRRHEH
ncbi:MAG: hypothetical protein MUF22_05010 [Chitinispirillaceae bacterium]|jgi:hypothetical protein|nr:hypothetical protein [Chitinispirillaceae bacterium]